MATNDSRPTEQAAHTEAQLQAWREGQTRAIALLRDLEDIRTEELDCRTEDREGKPQSNVVFRHTVSLLNLGDHDALGAFTAVLTHFMGNAVHGTALDADYVERETREPIVWDIPRRPLRLALQRVPTQGVAHG